MKKFINSISFLDFPFPGIFDFFQKNYLLSITKLFLFFVSIVFSYYNSWNIKYIVMLITALIISSSYNNLYYNYKKTRDTKLKFGLVKKEDIGRLAEKPIWWLPILNWPLIFLLPAIFLILFLAKETEVSYHGITNGIPVALELFKALLHPSWNLFHEAVTIYARQTIEVAILGTLIALFISIPISFICAWNLMRSNLFTKIIYSFTRIIIVIIRAVPTFLWGLIFVALVGLGPFPGVLSIIIFSCGIMIKLFSEVIENIDRNLAETVYSCGGNQFHNIKFVIIPQSIPMIIAQTLYCIEINVHSATVLGLIGAQGIGLPIHEYLTSLSYNNAATFIFVTIVMTIIIDYTSAYLRNKLLRVGQDK
jgi:phosphonate transport system permease protein